MTDLDQIRAECLSALRAAMERDLGPVSDEDFAATNAVQYIRAPTRTRASLNGLLRQLTPE